MTITRAYKTELAPTPEQRQQIEQIAHACRFVYNRCLEAAEWQYDIWRSTRSHEARPKLENFMGNGVMLRQVLATEEEYGWIKAAPSVAINAAMQNLDRAFQHFFRRVRNGETPGYPKKKRGKIGMGWKFLSTATADEWSITLPKVGAVALKEGGYIPQGKRYKIRSGAVTEHEGTGRWYVSVTVDEEIPDPTPGEKTVAIHLGIRQFATIYDGATVEVIGNPRNLSDRLRRIGTLQREKAKVLDTKPLHWRAKAGRLRKRIAVLHKQIADTRLDAVHKLTSGIVERYNPGRIIMEGWNVREMMERKPGEPALGRAIADRAWGTIRQQIEYKSQWAGATFIQIEPGFPSSKRCSSCSEVDKDFTTAHVFRCPACGHTEDRETNAVKNVYLQSFGS